MVHAKWLAALVLAVSVTAYVSMFLTEKYVTEILIGYTSEITIANNNAYASIIEAMDTGRHEEAKTKLRKLLQIEIDQLVDFRNQIESGYFTGLNHKNTEAIERINRYLSSIGDAAAR